MQPQIRYLSDNLPQQERIITIASCYGLGAGESGGVIALTETQLVFVLGNNTRNGFVGEEVLTYKFGDISDLSFNAFGKGGCTTVLDLTSNRRLTMLVGSDPEGALAFLHRVQQQLNRFRLR